MPRRKSTADDAAFTIIARAVERLIERHGGRNAAAHEIGIDPSQLTKLREGRTWPSPDTLARLGLHISSDVDATVLRVYEALGRMRAAYATCARFDLDVGRDLLAQRAAMSAEDLARMLEGVRDEGLKHAEHYSVEYLRGLIALAEHRDALQPWLEFVGLAGMLEIVDNGGDDDRGTVDPSASADTCVAAIDNQSDTMQL